METKTQIIYKHGIYYKHINITDRKEYLLAEPTYLRERKHQFNTAIRFELKIAKLRAKHKKYCHIKVQNLNNCIELNNKKFAKTYFKK